MVEYIEVAYTRLKPKMSWIKTPRHFIYSEYGIIKVSEHSIVNTGEEDLVMLTIVVKK